MCEILIRVVDKTNPDPYQDCKLMKRGDIVTVQPDGWGWCGQELTNPDWRILKLPNVPLAVVESFIGPEFDVDPQNPSRMLRRRAFNVDLDNAALSASLRSWLADDTRKAPTRTSNFTAAQFTAFKRAKARLSDPNVIG